MNSCKKVDAVSLCVPTPYHYKTASDVLKTGISTLIEKPICQTSDEAKALLSDLPGDIIIGVGAYRAIQSDNRRNTENYFKSVIC